MTILVLNCGSSSIKYQVIKMQSTTQYQLLGKGIIERIGLPEGKLEHKPTGKSKFEIVKHIPDHAAGVSLILRALTNSEHGIFEDINEIKAVGHRVAHGGEFFPESAVINKVVKEKIESCNELAPLHNPANLRGILAMEQILPNVPQVAVFDTSFHQTMPAKNFLYGLPYKYYEQDRVRRYGFHGTSHKYVAGEACKMVGLDICNSKIITCHLGGGASVTAIVNGKSIDTSMGFTPLEGLIMGTRCGDIDAGALIFIAKKEGLNLDRIGDILNKESGVQGISGVSSDMRDINNAVEEGNERAIIAMDMYTSRIKKYIGAYTALMGGLDLIVFTGGVGENDYIVRQQTCSDLEFLGIEFDNEFNHKKRSIDLILSKPESKVKVVTVATNEELVIATDTFLLTKKRSE